jgi:hypothetical protein
MRKWEYKFITESIDTNEPAAIDAILNRWGQEGWEAVNFEYQFHAGFESGSSERESLRCLLKRPIA